MDVGIVCAGSRQVCHFCSVRRRPYPYAAGSPAPAIWCSDDDHKGVLMAVENLQADFEK